MVKNFEMCASLIFFLVACMYTRIKLLFLVRDTSWRENVNSVSLLHFVCDHTYTILLKSYKASFLQTLFKSGVILLSP